MTTVHLRGLTKVYPHTTANAVHDLSFNVPSGELVALLGPSGCGKTTRLKMIAGLLAPTSGDILFDRRSVAHVPPERREVAMVFQKPLLFPYMTIGENIGFGLRMRCEKPAVIRARVQEMLELVRLPGLEARRPHQLSGGQEQRVALARALIIQPRVLLLDEPLSQLDASLRAEMRELIGRIQEQLRITTLFVTHDQEEAVVLADRIALLFNGTLHQYETPRGFYTRPASVRVARFFGGLNFIDGRKQGQTFVSDVGTFHLTSDAPDGPGILTIRPEAVQLSAHGSNVVHGRVVSSTYLGTQMRYRVALGSVELHVVADPSSDYLPGASVALALPSERLWVMPEGDTLAARSGESEWLIALMRP